MFETNNTPPGGGNWGWLSAAVFGLVSAIQAIAHRRKPQRNIPAVNADEAFSRLNDIEGWCQTYAKDNARMRGEMASVRETLLDLQRQVVVKDDLVEFDRRIRKLLGVQGD